jgi:hypothetical protein
MRWFRFILLTPAVLLGFSGCAPYDPPIRGDRKSDHYKADLEACRAASSHAVYLKNADNPWSWMISPITGPPMVRAEIRSCLTGRGYVIENPGG